MRRTILLGLSILLLTGCGASGGKRQSANESGSVPVKTVPLPSRTATYNVPSSSMEPTLHCAQPAQGCEAQVSDGAVVQEPASDLRRADIVLFRTPDLALHECGAEGKFIKRVIGLPGDVWEERTGFVYINGKKLNESYIRPERRDDATMGLSDLPPRNTYTRIPKGMYLISW
jgi:signal peptidase I